MSKKPDATTQVHKIKQVTFWSLLSGLLLAWMTPFLLVMAEQGRSAPLSFVVGGAGLAVFSWVYVRAVKRMIVAAPARREVVLSGVIALLVSLLALWTPGQQGLSGQQGLTIGWPTVLAVWAALAAIDQSRKRAFLTWAAVSLISVPLAGWGGPPAAFYVFLSAVLICANRFQIWLWEVLREAHEGREAMAKLAVSQERLRFSRDLHDTVGHSLSAIAVKSELAARLSEVDAAKAAAEMTEVRRLARESLREIRAVVHGYRSVDLGAELRSVAAVMQAAGIDCVLETTEADIPDELGTLLAWVVRESTTNVLRHSSATSCRITLGVTGGKVELEIVNDGVPANGHGDRQGSGIPGMTERVSSLGGVLTVGSARPGEFRLRAVLPLS